MSDPEQENRDLRQPQELAGDVTKPTQGDSSGVVGDQVRSTEAAAPSDSELTGSELDGVAVGTAKVKNDTAKNSISNIH